VSGVCRAAGEIHCPARVAGLRLTRTERRVLYSNRLVVLWGMDCVPPHTRSRTPLVSPLSHTTKSPSSQLTHPPTPIPSASCMFSPRHCSGVICPQKRSARCTHPLSFVCCVVLMAVKDRTIHCHMSRTAVAMATSASSNREAVWFARHPHLHSHTHSHTSPTR
jgi:hypothetical protein